jgi:hypothetical protein
MIWAEQHNLYGVKLIVRATIRGFRSRNLRNPETGRWTRKMFSALSPEAVGYFLSPVLSERPEIPAAPGEEPAAWAAAALELSATS